MPAALIELLVVGLVKVGDVLAFDDLVEVAAFVPQDTSVKVKAVTKHTANKRDLVFTPYLLFQLSSFSCTLLAG